MGGVDGCALKISASIIAGHLNCPRDPGRRKEPFVASSFDGLLKLFSFVRFKKRAQILDRETLARERWRLQRKWLRRPCDFSGHIGARHCPFFDWPKGLPGFAIEYPDETLFSHLRNHVAHFSVVANRKQHRRGSVVIVPNIVVHHLEIPD